jgi:hypothetical protein
LLEQIFETEYNLKNILKLNPKPIFIFSLPRSGSTLIQRILGYHDDVATISEPWILLPILYAMKKEGGFSEFNQNTYSIAFKNVLNELPNGKDDYYDAVRAYANVIYKRLCTGKETYFLDKTPRYYLIIKEIFEIFPDAKFIFLFRHPLSVYSSIIDTYNSGRLGTYWNKIDLYKGPVELEKGYELLKDDAIALKFEDLIRFPQKNIKKVCDYLELQFYQKMIDQFNTMALKGNLGDSIGVVDYHKLSDAPINKWKKVFNTNFRKKYAKRYIQKFNEKTFNNIGYSREDILHEIDSVDIVKKGSVEDRLSIVSSEIRSLFEIPIIKLKLKRLIRNKNKYYLNY